MSEPKTPAGKLLQGQLDNRLTTLPYFDRDMERKLVGCVPDITHEERFLQSLKSSGVLSQSLIELKERYPVTSDRVIYAIETIRKKKATAALIFALENSDNVDVILSLSTWCCTFGASASVGTKSSASFGPGIGTMPVMAQPTPNLQAESRGQSASSVGDPKTTVTLIHKRLDLIGGDEPFETFLRPYRSTLGKKTLRLENFMRELKALGVLKESDIQKINRENSTDEARCDKVYEMIIILDAVDGMVEALRKSNNSHIVKLLHFWATEDLTTLSPVILN